MTIVTASGTQGHESPPELAATPHATDTPDAPIDLDHPLVNTIEWLTTTAQGRILFGTVLLLLACVFNTSVRKAVLPFWRLATGGLVLTQPSPWDSTWDKPAPERPTARPNFRGERYPRTRWGKMPGYQRMAIRWTAAGYLYLLWHWPLLVMASTALAGAVITGRKLYHLVQDHVYDRTASEFATGVATVLGKRDDDAATFIAMPRLRVLTVPIALDERVTRTVRRLPKVGSTLEHVLGRLAVPTVRIALHDDDAQVLVHLDADMVDQTKVQAIKHLGQARLPEGPWEATHHERQLVVAFVHPKRPPAEVWYDAEANQHFTIDNVPIGQRAGGQWVTLPLKAQTPHGIVSATTGWCKTTTANTFVAHTAGNGGKVYINDPKRTGYLHLQGLPNVVIRTTADGWAHTNAEFLAEMERRYELIERFPEIKEDPEKYFEPWFMVNDERGSYVADLKEWAKARGEKGIPLPLRQEKKILWQGRAAAMYVCDLAQQANLQVFLDSDGRDQRMWRIASGPQTLSSWRMLFPGIAKRSAGMKKGRAMLGIGVDSVEEITLARTDDAMARDFAEKGAAIAGRENILRAQRLRELTANATDAPETPAPDHSTDAGDPGQMPETAPGHDDSPRAQTPDSVPAENGTDSGWDNVTPIDSAKAQKEPANSGTDESQDDPETDLIVGIQAGADYLGMTRSNFESTRKRRRIPGEVRRKVNGIDQPAWTPLDLREWRAQSPRAGAS